MSKTNYDTSGEKFQNHYKDVLQRMKNILSTFDAFEGNEMLFATGLSKLPERFLGKCCLRYRALRRPANVQKNGKRYSKNRRLISQSFGIFPTENFSAKPSSLKTFAALGQKLPDEKQKNNL